MKTLHLKRFSVLDCRDSETPSTDHMMHSRAATNESPVKAFHCSHCSLIFKSKVYLFEHLNNVHGFDVDQALREAGLKQPVVNKASADNKSSSPGRVFLCRHCQFKTCEWTALKQHECQRGLAYGNNSESPETKISVTSRNQHKEAAGTKDISSYYSVSSTSKTKCLPTSSKELKTPQEPLQTNTKYLTGSSGTMGEAPVMSLDSCPDYTKGTLILQESSSNSSGVFKVTAKSKSDITGIVPDEVLSNKSQKLNEELRETVASKRTTNKNTEDPNAKKGRSCKEEMDPVVNGKTNKQQASTGDLSFEVSEEDDLDNAEIPTFYFCKQCDYSDVSIRCVFNHYQNNHPYVRFNSDYIQDPHDQSATFRCLECPVEFSAVPELKRHYKESHPQAPDVIVTQSHELNLAFRCFVCQFTSNELKALKEHYKEKHPTHKADNSLLYCRFSVTRCQSTSSRLNTCEKTPEEISSEGTQALEVESAASLQQTISKPEDGTLYCCSSCNFTHKSVVVIHVHCQKSHPGEPISIDKIEQSHSPSSVTTEKSPNPATEIQSCTPQKSTSGSSSMSLAHKSEASKIHVLSPKLKEVDSAEDGSKAQKTLIKHEIKVSADTDSSSDKTFYCCLCSYSSTNVRSVLGHHNAKHLKTKPISIEDILCYNAKAQNNKLHSQVKVYETGKTIVHKKALQFEESGASVKEFNAYECPEKLFYCQECNFANPTLKGVVNHQIQRHRHINSNKESVLRHTSLICEEIEKSKSSTSATCLPLPLLNEGDENVLFCHFCNYRHSTMEQIMKHYFNRHRGSGITPNQIRLHTSLIREKTMELHAETAGNFGDKTIKKKSKKLATPFSNSLLANTKILKCHRCSYNTPSLYILRRHMWKIHRSNRSGPDILRMCFRRGSIQSGYHCDLCDFSPKNAEVLHQHYQEKHPESIRSLDYISTRLYVGPDTCARKKKHKVKHTEASLPSQASVENEANTYSCKACSFKGSSLSDMTSHYRTVHPWSVKDDGSDPGVKISKKRSANGQLKDQNEILASFDSYQIPLDFDNSSCEANDSHKVFKCFFCPASFFTQHSLRTHCGMKHQDDPTGPSKPKRKHLQIHSRVHIFKCPHCSYINSNYQGVITHCQMKHPSLEFKADSLHLDTSSMKDLDDSLEQSIPGGSLKYRGYMCNICQKIYVTKEKLNKHHDKCHKQVNTPKPAAETSPVSKIKQSNAYSTQGSVSKASFLRKKIYAKVQCQHCRYSCTTNMALRRHMHLHHRDSSVSSVNDYSYIKCALCVRFFSKKRIGNHYFKKHGEDAFLKYYVPICREAPQKSLPASAQPSSELPETASEQQKSSTMMDEKVLVYRCPACPYVNASVHGTLTHCQMVHSDLVARADELQTREIFVNNLVKCTLGKSSNERGYMCNKCPQIHASLMILNMHIERHHNRPKPLDEAHKLTDASLMDPPALEDNLMKNKTSEAKTTETNPSQQPDTPKACQSNQVPSLQTIGQFKCHMCTYEGSCRKYLYCHYKYTHKLDAFSTFNLLEKYNKRKSRFRRLMAAPSEESAQIKCKKCLNKTFSSSQLLIAHYSTFHCKMDFTVLASVSQRSTGSYKCRHCKKIIHGLKNLLCHLERHRARRMKRAKAAEAQATHVTTTTPKAKSNELVQRNAMPEEATSLHSPANSTDQEHPEVQSRDHKHGCRLCRRTFMSLKGLRSHERSHAALAAIKNLDNVPYSALKQNINKHVLYKAGTLRPFLCTFCSYRTTVLGLWKSHVMKKHRDVLMEAEETGSQDEQRFTQEPLHLTAENNSLPEIDIKTEMTEKSLYLEPPDVQRQLNQYSLMAQVGVSSKTNKQESSQIHCEFCNFNTGHLSSIRRHYLNRHGRKIFRCKDCDFFTGIRKTLEKHMHTGHCTFRSEPAHQKGFHCPFCLYQTKNKNNMIDHIVLHREQRVVPIEVRRSKLSHYLQGVIFRCHKCTFTSGNAENLQLHMMRHDDIRPYKCRLCYFDCTHLSELEAHLSDKHQVMRNHDLVGHVSLDQLEAVCKTPEEEDESLSNLEQDNNDDEFDIDRNDGLPAMLAKNPSDHDFGAKNFFHNLENELDPQERAVHLTNTASGQMMKNDMCSNDAAVQFPEKQNQCTARNIKYTPKQESAEWSSKGYDEKATKAQVHHMPALDEKGCKRDGTVKMEQSSNPEVVHDCENQLLNEKSNLTEPNSPPDIKKKVDDTRAPVPVEKGSQTSQHSCAHLEISHKGNFGLSVASKEEVVRLADGEMPVLGNVCVKEEMSPVCKEDEETDLVEQEQKRADKTTDEDENTEREDEGSVKDDGVLQEHRGTATVEPAEVLCPSATEKKLYTCKFCGRSLPTSQELTRHVMRHGM